ncbi:MAG: hypothetical protein CL623_08270 [Arcobacter sp.]|nr:hypothetical protein [Arcobacter sp.]|tara:strand:- start:2044 stop:3012 length:969 start_codon:yes stop_codon:yes gene_type:complete
MLTIAKNNNLCNEHYNTIKNVNHVKSTMERILRNGGLRKKINGVMAFHTLSPNDIQFLNKINRNSFLKRLICIKPENIRTFIEATQTKYPDIYDTNTLLYKCVYNIFVKHGYEKSENLNKYEFIKNIGLESCPYCNRSYIYTLNRNKNIKPEIDHFYPKGLYPILALSYYNLIPSCPTCNGLGAKSNQDSYLLNLKNPYLIENDDFKFNFKIKTLNILNPLSDIDKDSVEIFFEKKVPNQANVFGLEELYKEHRDVIIELYIKTKHQYVNKYVDYLHSYNGLTFSEDEIYRLITSGYKDEKDHHKRPLSKLIKDISDELGLV